MSWARALAEGRVSQAVDVYAVYKALFRGERPDAKYEPYCDAASFFSLTFVTPAFRQYLEDFLKKLAAGESEVYLMPAMLGAGKSHFLALVLHVLALYRRCNGVGACVKRELERFKVELWLPDLPKTPSVYVFHGEYELSEEARRLRSVDDKDKLKRVLREDAPVVLIFDETRNFEEREKDFYLWMQMLAEAVSDVPGAFLFVSYSLFPSERPETASSKSQDAVRRVHHVLVSLDAVSNIVQIFRRWAGVAPRRVDLSPLRGAVDDKLLADFERRLVESYPFNPYVLDVVLKLADESLAQRTRVQLTRELLRTLAKSYLNAGDGELVVFAHLPDPGEVLVAGGDEAELWRTLLSLYRQDLAKLGDKPSKTAVSVLRHILLATFLARLMPRAPLYPTEDELVLGSFNGRDVRPLDVRGFLQTASGLHIEKIFENRWVYWYIGDVAHAVAQAMLKFGDEVGLELAADEVAGIAREKSAAFDKVVVAGAGEARRVGKVLVVSTKEEWERELQDAHRSILAVDLRDFGVPRRRNNLVVIRRVDGGEVPQVARAVLKELEISPRNVREAVVDLGRAVKAVEEVDKNLPVYFAELLQVGTDALRAEFEEMLRARLRRWGERAKLAMRQAVGAWLRRAVVGLREEEVKMWEELLTNLNRDKRELVRDVVVKVFEGGLVSWDSFKKLGDLWSLFLNNESFPPVPISFSEFAEAVKNYCGSCNCLFEDEGRIYWLTKGEGCEMPQLDEDVGVAPFLARNVVSEWAVEQFLKQLAGERVRRYYVVYKRPSGEEVRLRADELLGFRGEWIYLNTGRLEEEQVRKSLAVRIDGLDTVFVDKDPGSSVKISVEASDDIGSLHYEFVGVEKMEYPAGRRYEFELPVPTKPGIYALKLEVRFKDGEEEHKTLYIRVRGRRMGDVVVSGVSAGDLVKKIRASTAKDAVDVLNYLTSKQVEVRVEISVEKTAIQGADDEALLLKARFAVRNIEGKGRVARLLKAIQDVSPALNAEFEFVEPFKVEEDDVQFFKGMNLIFEVVKEA
ncbi:hypothetical protein Pogu_0012 [Pyrobaculum oguniense TE7]|uniref:ATPase (AAA+ superfamily) n=1 Tax=Pyrobaculum oguniense (strain DSM 13380 / JCM 10595 / TE7) TaxID=698757 RepID=H6Q609_PYROT|nr:hypothetical protein Pogu_0012 [Pyrobaculum oguniense TE7]